MDIKDHFDIIHARGPLFTDIELCEATAAGESGVRSLAYRPIVKRSIKKQRWEVFERGRGRSRLS